MHLGLQDDGERHREKQGGKGRGAGGETELKESEDARNTEGHFIRPVSCTPNFMMCN